MMKPKTIAVLECEGGHWIPFNKYLFSDIGNIHAIQFDDGSEWDCVNGWRWDGKPNPYHPMPIDATGWAEAAFNA